MPSLDEIKQKRHKKFIKKPYRMWDITGTKNTINSNSNKKNNLSASSYNISSSLKKIKNQEEPTIKQYIRQQRDNDQITERQRSDNKQQPDNRETTTRQQLDNNQTANKQQGDINQTTVRQRLDNKETTERQQADNKTDNKLDNRETTERQQITNIKIISDEELVEIIKSLSGLQEKFFYLIIEYCNLNNDTQTGKLKTSKVALLIGCNYQCAKIIIERVTKKSIVKRLKGKGSIAGYIQFELLKEIKAIGNRLALQKQEIDTEFKKFILQIRQQIRQQSDNKSDNIENSSSSFLLNTTTTTNDFGNLNTWLLSNEWKTLDIEPLKEIGFTTTHLNQIASQNKLSPQVVQDSIYAFAFDLQENDKSKSIKGDPINFFMGILRNGRVYTFPSNYESPQDKAMRLYTEQLRAVNQKREAIEKEATDLAYTDWFEQLTEEQKIAFLPEMLRRNANSKKLEKSKVLESSARSYFEKEIWPTKKNEIAQNTEKKPQNTQNQLQSNIDKEVSNVEEN
jgi:hypothetical protein